MMRFWELLILAVGLSMDAFAVAVCKGLSIRALMPRHAAVVGLWFGEIGRASCRERVLRLV